MISLESRCRLLRCFLILGLVSACVSIKLDILMPKVSPQTKDTYLCHQFKMNPEKPIYITEFKPESTKQIAHHILLFGCDDESVNELWNCGEMSSGTKNPQYKSGPVCKGKQSIIYAWAMDAPELKLPTDVAFKLGGTTQNKFLVLQIHYANVDAFKLGHTDSSGIILTGQSEPLKHQAGVYILETDGEIEPGTLDYFEAACEMNEKKMIHPFAYRTHTHKLGVVNSGYVVKTDPATGEQKWIEIGRRSPQLPQMFFPASNNITVNPGDILAARCTMENLKDETVHIGATGNDEMCNFYVMYYVEGDKILDNNICFTPGPPEWFFENFESSTGKRLDVSKVPEDASEVPSNQVAEMSDSANHQGMMMMPEDMDTSNQIINEDESEQLNEEIKKFLMLQNLRHYVKELEDSE